MRLISAGSEVRALSGPAFARSSAQSEGCHAGVSEGGRILSKLASGASRLRLGKPFMIKRFFYVYILVSEADSGQHYTGITQDLSERLKQHNQGTCSHTSKYQPWRIETLLAFRSGAKARAFERYLKTGSGREFCRRHL